MTKHARLSPSNHRWPHCPGSVREEAKYPDTSNKFSIDGTGTHALVDILISDRIFNGKRRTFEYYRGVTIDEGYEDKPEGWLVTEDRFNRAKVVIDYMNERGYFESDYRIETELKVHISDGWYGTTDVLVYKSDYEHSRGDHQLKEMEIIDFKDGNTYVSEKNNSQLISYAYGSLGKISPKSHLQGFLYPDGEPINALHRPDPKTNVRMTIIQPKTSPQVRTQTMTFEELDKKMEVLAEAAELTDDPNAPLIPDKENGNGYCKWCKHRNHCVELNAVKKRSLTMIKEIAVNDTIDILSSELKKIPSDKLAKVYTSKETYDEFFGKIADEMTRRLNEGLPVPGYDMVSKRTVTRWKESNEAVEKMLRPKGFKTDDIYVKKLITPSKVLASDKLTDVQKKRIESKFMCKKEGGKVLKSVQTKLKSFIDDMKVTVLQSNTSNKNKISFL